MTILKHSSSVATVIRLDKENANFPLMMICDITSPRPSSESISLTCGRNTSACRAALSSPSKVILSAILVSSKALRSLLTSSEKTGLNFALSRSSNSTGECTLIVARSYDRYAISLLLTSFSCNLPFVSSICAYTPSKVPYLASKSLAVFSPTPATPGMLSEASPINDLRSIICDGARPSPASIFSS